MAKSGMPDRTYPGQPTTQHTWNPIFIIYFSSYIFIGAAESSIIPSCVKEPIDY